MKFATLLTFLLGTISLYAQGPQARTALNLEAVYQQYNLSGAGTVVVMIDRGIDYTHPDFIDENGQTRIAYLYDMVDQSGANASGNPYGIGTIFSKDQINASLQNGGAPLSTDRYGHGTATTGIICGNGSGTNDRQFQGVAPEATIISIKITHDYFPAFGNQPQQNSFFDPNYVPIALQFAKDKIEELGLPSVTLMNIGSIGGPTDGTSKIARSIDDFIRAGHPFVCGVGDDGGKTNYTRGEIPSGQRHEIKVNKGDVGFLRFDLWYAESDRFTVSIERPNGMVEGPFTAPSGRTGIADQNLGDIFIGHRGADTEFFEATSNRRELLIDFSGATGVYKVILEGVTISGGGTYQASLNPARYYGNNEFLDVPFQGGSINDYSSATLCISPGDYVSDNSWRDVNGVLRQIQNEGAPGELWLGSSAGPTHDGRLGTDFVAPGEVCFGAYSPNTYYSNFTFNQISGSNGLYGVQNAVSAAAPITAGIISLMLEVNPNLSPEEIRTLLQESSEGDTFTGAVPNASWGYGKLNALLAIQNTLNVTDLTSAPALQTQLNVFPNPTTDKVTFQLDNPGLTPLTLELFNHLGQPVWSKVNNLGPQIEVSLKRLPAGVYTAIMRFEGFQVSRKLVKTKNP